MLIGEIVGKLSHFIDGRHPRMSADQLHRSRGALDPYRHSLCALALLAPDIQSAILEGRQPPGLKLEQLIHTKLPIAWEEQRTLLGFSAPS